MAKITRRVHPGVSDILFYICLLGFLKTIMNNAGFPVAFTTNVYGESGSTKTRMVKLFCGCYKKPDQTLAYSSNFQEKWKILGPRLQRLHDVNYLVDDFHPTKDAYEKTKQTTLLDHIVRMPGDCPEGANVIMTSESREGVYSNQDRQLQLYVYSGSHKILLADLERNSGTLTQIYYGFLCAVIKHYSEVFQEIHTWYQKCNCAAYEYRCDLFAQQLYLVEYLFFKYYITDEPQFYRIKDSLEDVLSRQKKGLVRLRHHETGIDPLVELKLMLEDNEIISYTYSKDDFDESGGKLVYKTSSKEDCLLYITKNALEIGMKKQTGDTSFQYGLLINKLVERGILKCPSKGSERTKKLRGKRCYVIKMKDLYEYIEGCRETRQYLSE